MEGAILGLLNSFRLYVNLICVMFIFLFISQSFRCCWFVTFFSNLITFNLYHHNGRIIIMLIQCKENDLEHPAFLKYPLLINEYIFPCSHSNMALNILRPNRNEKIVPCPHPQSINIRKSLEHD